MNAELVILLFLIFVLFLGWLTRKWIWTRNIYVLLLTFITYSALYDIYSRFILKNHIFPVDSLLIFTDGFLFFYFIYYLYSVKKSPKRSIHWYTSLLFFIIIGISIPFILLNMKITFKNDGPMIKQFSSITLNGDETITVTPFSPYMGCRGEHDDCGAKVVILKKGETYRHSDGFHAYGSVTYKGVKDNQLVFEIMDGFNAISFGGGVSEERREKKVYPYTKEQFADGREKEILEHLEFNEENKNEIARLINKLGIANELLLMKYEDIEYVKFLVENGANINYEDDEGKTILFSTILNNGTHGIDTLPILINLGIDIHHKDKKNKEVTNYIKEKIQDNDHYGEYDKSYLFIYEEMLKGINPLEANEETCNKLSDFEFINLNERGSTRSLPSLDNSGMAILPGVFIDDSGMAVLSNVNEPSKGFCLPRCLKGQFRSKNGDCTSCNFPLETESTREECQKCPNRTTEEFTPGYPVCVRDYMFCPEGTIKATNWGRDEFCASCIANHGIETTEDECNKCPNRRMSDNRLCVLRGCPKGQILNYSSCESCDIAMPLQGTKKNECLKCPNRKYVKDECVLK